MIAIFYEFNPDGTLLELSASRTPRAGYVYLTAYPGSSVNGVEVDAEEIKAAFSGGTASLNVLPIIYCGEVVTNRGSIHYNYDFRSASGTFNSNPYKITQIANITSASYARTATSASYAPGSPSISASFATNALTASYALNAAGGSGGSTVSCSWASQSLSASYAKNAVTASVMKPVDTFWPSDDLIFDGSKWYNQTTFPGLPVMQLYGGSSAGNPKLALNAQLDISANANGTIPLLVLEDNQGNVNNYNVLEYYSGSGHTLKLWVDRDGLLHANTRGNHSGSVELNGDGKTMFLFWTDAGMSIGSPTTTGEVAATFHDDASTLLNGRVNLGAQDPHFVLATNGASDIVATTLSTDNNGDLVQLTVANTLTSGLGTTEIQGDLVLDQQTHGRLLAVDNADTVISTNLHVDPSGNVTGSFTGSLQGTSSFAISASYAPSSPGTLGTGSTYPFTASFSVTSSRAVTSSFAISSSYALSASYAPSTPGTLGTGSSYPFTSSWANTSSVSISSSYALSASIAQTASFLTNYQSYVTDVTSSTNFVTLSFASPNHQLNLPVAHVYSFTSSNTPTVAGQCSDIVCYISHSVNATSSFVWPAQWKNVGGTWPAAMSASTIGTLWLRAIDTNQMIGTWISSQ